MANGYIFQKSIFLKLFILFVYLQVITEETNSYFITLKIENENKMLGKLIHSFYEKCLGSCQECEGPENVSYFQASI